MTTVSPLSPAPRLVRWLGWAAAWSPALGLLLLILPLRMQVPFEDSWAYVAQYRDWWQGEYGWQAFFAPHNNHPSAVGKFLYFVVLHWLGGDVSVLPLLAWVFSLVIAVAAAMMARPCWQGRPARGMLLMFAANLTIFTAAQGHAWIWDFIYQNFIPGAAFCAALGVLWRWPSSWMALAAAAVLAILATFSFGTGLLAGLLLLPMVWRHFPARGRVFSTVVSGAWLALMGVTAWVALKAFGEAVNTGSESRVTALLGDSPLLAQFFLVLLGYLLGNGATLEPGILCAVMGAGLVLVLAVALVRLWQIRREPGAVAGALPWLLIAFFGMGNAALIAYGRLRASLISAMAPRYVTFTLFFALGVLLLAAAVAHADRHGGWYRRLLRRAGPLLLGAFITMHALNWAHGWQHMRWEHERMRQDRAMLTFSKVLPLDGEVMWYLDDDHRTETLALFLESIGRLRGVRMVESTNLQDYSRKSPLLEKWAWLDVPVLKEGALHLQGACGVSKDTVTLPELILITAQAEGATENVISFAIPRQPFDFYENEWLRRQHVAHYFGWERDLAVERFPKGRVTVRAYGYWTTGRSVRALSHEHVLDL